MGNHIAIMKTKIPMIVSYELAARKSMKVSFLIISSSNLTVYTSIYVSK